MPKHASRLSYVVVGIASAFVAAVALGTRAQAESGSQGHDNLDGHRVSVAVARDRAKTMHEVYTATLETMHHYYFHGDRATVPAKAMEDVFAELRRQTKTEARWISVSLRPMSIHHEPKSDFEKKAAKEIASGKAEFDAVEGGYYRRAGAIQLTSGCIACHSDLFRGAQGKAQFAGLVISIPVTGDSGKVK